MSATVKLAAVLAGALLVLAGCAGPGQRVGGAELVASIEAGDAPVVLDVRSTTEYEAGHVPGAVHLPFQSTWSGHAALPVSKAEPVLLYCEHGPRAGMARFGLESLGYERVLSLEGHMARWRAEARPITVGPSP